MKYTIIALLVWNLITFAMMGLDKFFAIHDKRRISESTLLLSALALGGAGALAGMYTFRHKTKTAKFLILVPVAVIINIIAFVGLYTIITPN